MPYLTAHLLSRKHGTALFVVVATQYTIGLTEVCFFLLLQRCCNAYRSFNYSSSIYLPTYLPIYLPTYLVTYLPTYGPVYHLSVIYLPCRSIFHLLFAYDLSVFGLVYRLSIICLSSIFVYNYFFFWKLACIPGPHTFFSCVMIFWKIFVKVKMFHSITMDM